jgi:hypothetical protein
MIISKKQRCALPNMSIETSIKPTTRPIWYFLFLSNPKIGVSWYQSRYLTLDIRLVWKLIPVSIPVNDPIYQTNTGMYSNPPTDVAEKSWIVRLCSSNDCLSDSIWPMTYCRSWVLWKVGWAVLQCSNVHSNAAIT